MGHPDELLMPTVSRNPTRGWMFSLDGQAGSTEPNCFSPSGRPVSTAGEHGSPLRGCGYGPGHGSLLVEVRITKSMLQPLKEQSHNGKLIVTFFDDAKPSCANDRASPTSLSPVPSLSLVPTPGSTSGTPQRPEAVSAPATGLKLAQPDRGLCQQMNIAPLGNPIIRLFTYANNPEMERRGLFISMSGKAVLTDSDFGDMEDLEPEGDTKSAVSPSCDRCVVMASPWAPAMVEGNCDEGVTGRPQDNEDDGVSDAEDRAAKKAAAGTEFDNDGRE